MTACIIADVTVTDQAQMVQYSEWSTRAMQEFGAAVLICGAARRHSTWRKQRRRWSRPMRAHMNPRRCVDHRAIPC